MTGPAPSSIRPARSDDLEAIAAVQHTVPETEMIGLTGSVDRARALGHAVVRIDGVTAPRRPHVVFERDGTVIGFLAHSRGPSRAGAPSLRLALAAVAVCGIHSVGLVRRLRIKDRVAVTAPADSFYIGELHAHPDRRGEGIGSTLIEWAVAEAARTGFDTLSLATTIGNPAQRLYERHGFEVIEWRTDPAYARMTGRAGRVLMARPA